MDQLALLSALPRSLEDLVAGATDRSKDYVRTQVLKNLNTPESAWARLKPHLKDDADALYDWCRDVGVQVTEKAGLKELGDALASHENVVVLAHWKGPEVHSKDLPDTIEMIAEVGQALGVNETVSAGTSARAARHMVQLALNERIRSWADWPLDLLHLGESDAVVGDYYGRCLAREYIDAALLDRSSCELVPGARLELADGLWSAQSIASCFPKGWTGVCDFVCCRSLYLSDIVKKHTRAGLIRADARYLQPERVLKVVRETLEAVEEGLAYQTAAYTSEENLR